MTQVNIHQAKTHLSKLIELVQQGEEVIIAKGNHPIAKLVLLETLKPNRKIGSAAGQIVISDDFDEPLADFESYRS
ncbi:MAG TPA: type II toxin-antitoxin system Phd/YefM family antitoxin [Calditrichia bacterium]|nr:type II toxin-antitoxin system Phd/YefM family antitoxin [Calditrichota bacterium]HQU72317.1 type II toxin-antitoxin system Phd/YefM family antitoxin [Calditrichia bacterium]HQV31492.1 type II toxin-antitoxin system Phd/YefM family antitoxin [Calditrichia bacterium]